MTRALDRLRHRALFLTAALLLAGASLRAQDTVRPPVPPTPTPAPGTVTRIGARLLVVFRPPSRGVRRERALTRGGDGARALLPSPAVDTLIGQTLRDAPYVAVCAGGEPDSARLTVRIRDTASAVMIALRPGLNRIPLAGAHVPLNDGDVAEWSLSTRSGEVFLHEFIQRLVVPSTPTVAALAKNGIWYDVLDLFVLDAMRGIPLASERLETFLTSVGGSSCSVEPPPR
jgi:hypothetical protein